MQNTVSTPLVHRSRATLVPLLLLASCGLSQAQPISEVVRTALKNHPRVLEAGAAIRAAEADVNVASSARNSRVSLAGSAGIERQAGGTGGLLAISPSIHWTKLIADGGRVDRDVDVRNARVNQAKASVRVVEEDIGLQVALAYVQLAQTKEALRLARSWVGSLEAIETMAREIQQIDRGRQVDWVHASSRVASGRAQLASRQAAVAQAAGQLDQLVDAHVFVETPVSLSFRLDPAAPVANAHPRTEVAQAVTRVAEAQLALDSLYDKPRYEVDAFIGSGRDAQGRMRLINQGGVRLLGNLNILDGGTGKATMDVSRQRIEQARTAEDGALREIRVGLARDIGAEQGSAERLAAYAITLAESARVRGLMFEQFKAGRRPLLDLLSQEADIYQSGIAHSQEEHEALLNKIRIAHGRGELLAAFGVASALNSRN